MAVEYFARRIQTDDDWMNGAECRGLTEIFFPPIAERPQARERRESMGHTRRDVHAPVTVRAVGPSTQIKPLGGAVGG